MDKLDLLQKLVKNADYTIDDLAKILSGDDSEVTAEITEFENDKILLGKHVVINWDKTNLQKVVAFIEVGVLTDRDSGYDKIASRIYRYQEVTDCYLLGGNTDLIVVIEGKTMQEVANFVAMKLAPIENIKSTTTHFILKTYMHTSVLFEDNRVIQERMAVS